MVTPEHRDRRAWRAGKYRSIDKTLYLVSVSDCIGAYRFVAYRDAFTKREEANENYYVKQREKEKSAALPDVLAICSLCHKVARTAKEDQGTARTS